MSRGRLCSEPLRTQLDPTRAATLSNTRMHLPPTRSITRRGALHHASTLAAGTLLLLAGAGCGTRTVRVDPAPTAILTEAPARDATLALPAEARALLADLAPVAPREANLDPSAACTRQPVTLPRESTAAYDATHRRWVVVDVSLEPGEEPAISWFGVATPIGEESLDTGAVTPAALCHALSAQSALVATPDLIDAVAEQNYALGTAHPLIRFGSWLLYANTSSGADDALHLFRATDDAHHVIATRPASCGPVDHAGCAAQPGSVACTAIRAWLTISAVRRAPDGTSLLVQGYVGPPDHPSAGPFHWVAALPSSHTADATRAE